MPTLKIGHTNRIAPLALNEKMDSDYAHEVLSNSLWNFLNYLIVGLSSMVVSIFLARYLGADKYGIYSFFISLINIGSLVLDFGLTQSIAKYVPRYFSDPNNKGLSISILKKE